MCSGVAAKGKVEANENKLLMRAGSNKRMCVAGESVRERKKSTENAWVSQTQGLIKS